MNDRSIYIFSYTIESTVGIGRQRRQTFGRYSAGPLARSQKGKRTAWRRTENEKRPIGCKAQIPPSLNPSLFIAQPLVSQLRRQVLCLPNRPPKSVAAAAAAQPSPVLLVSRPLPLQDSGAASIGGLRAVSYAAERPAAAPGGPRSQRRADAPKVAPSPGSCTRRRRSR
jgi:hypothetical protein